MDLFLKTKDHAVTGESFELLHDPELDMLYTVPKPKEIDKYYNHSSYISHTDGARTIIEKLYQWVKQINLRKKFRWIKKYSVPNPKVLDVGAGTGDFIQYIQKRGIESFGVEPNKLARNNAERKGVMLGKSFSDLKAKKFDAITLWHVLEHLDELENDLESLSDLMNVNGAFFVAVPNFRSYDAQHYGSFWAGYDVPRHLSHFSKKAIDKIFGKYGYKIITTKPMIFDAFYISLLSEKYQYGHSRFFAAMWQGIRSCCYGWRTGEHSSVLYVLQKAD